MNGKSISLFSDLAARDLPDSHRKNSIEEEMEAIMRFGFQSALKLS